MSDINHAYRAEYVLSRFKTGIPPAVKGIGKKGTEVRWKQTQRLWVQWYLKNNFTQATGGSKYTGLSNLMVRGEKITDASDPRWTKDLELGRFKLDQLDVGFAIDSTGSMGSIVAWIKRDVIKMMRAFELISREPRIGVVLYRDHGDDYVVWPIPLSHSAQALAKKLRGASAAGGGDMPEAIYPAMAVLLKKQRWSRSARAKKVVVLIGDAPPHEKTVEKIEKLVKAAAGKNFMVYAIKVRTHLHPMLRKLPNWDRKLTTFDKIAEWGNGQSFWVSFTAKGSHRDIYGVARPLSADAPEQIIFRRVFKAAVAAGYEDRIDSFVNVLMQYVNHSWKEQRRHRPPHKPGKPGKPRNPQERKQ